jgi:hypothetical protein
MNNFAIKPFDRNRMESDPKSTPCSMMGRAGDDLMGNFWPSVLDEMGLLGFYAEREATSPNESPRTIAHLVFFPKLAARKLAYPTSYTNDSIDKTLYLWCINGLPIKDSLAHVDALVKAALDFAKTNGYVRFEACSAASGSQQHNATLLENGFKVDDTVKKALSAQGLEHVEVLFWENK